MPQRDYLSFERTPRPEEVQEDPPEQIEELEHPAFIARFGRSDQVDGICDRDTVVDVRPIEAISSWRTDQIGCTGGTSYCPSIRAGFGRYARRIMINLPSAAAGSQFAFAYEVGSVRDITMSIEPSDPRLRPGVRSPIA